MKAVADAALDWRAPTQNRLPISVRGQLPFKSVNRFVQFLDDLKLAIRAVGSIDRSLNQRGREMQHVDVMVLV
jgi:hypothetical protein